MVKMFCCSQCDFSFSGTDALKRHIQTLHGFKDRQVAAPPPPPQDFSIRLRLTFRGPLLVVKPISSWCCFSTVERKFPLVQSVFCGYISDGNLCMMSFNRQSLPRVDFIQWIPLELDQDSFIHPGTKNLVILDDFMSTAAKDSRINE